MEDNMLTASAERMAGIVLAGSAAASVLVMAHHPTHAGSGLAEPVHGTMIALSAALAFGFLHYAVGRGLWRPAILAGAIAYSIALFGNIGAAAINGFAVPALAATSGGDVSGGMFRFAWEMNQTLASLGVAATGAAFALWSLDLLAQGTRPARLLAIMGFAAGFVPLALLGLGGMGLDVRGAMIVYTLHAAFAFAMGLWLWRRKS